MMSGNFGMISGFMWFFWIFIIVGLYFIIKWILQQNQGNEVKIEENPLEILKRRYAKGEIEREEFEEKNKDLFN